MRVLPEDEENHLGVLYWQIEPWVEKYELSWLVDPFLQWFSINRLDRYDDKYRHSSAADYDPTSRVTYSLALKPDDSTAERLHLDRRLNREVVCIYSPYPQLDMRAVNLRDRLVQGRGSRYDPSLSIVVSDDPSTWAIINELLNTDPERLPIVGVSRQEVSEISESGGLDRLFYQRHFTRDLFAMSGVITSDALLFGRSQLLTTATNRVAAGENTGIFGLRRMGKSSVLRAVERRTVSSRVSTPVFVDLQAYSNTRYYNVLSGIIRRLAEQLSSGRGAAKSLHATDVAYDAENAGAFFVEDIAYIVERLAPHNRVTVLFDEIERVSFGGISDSPHWEDDFLPMWRSVRAAHQALDGRFTFMIAGTSPQAVEEQTVAGRDNPLFGTVATHYLQPFEIDTVRQMIGRISGMMGLTVDTALVDEVVADIGGHPYLLRQAFSYLSGFVRGRPGAMRGGLYRDHHEDLKRILIPMADYILSVLARWYPDEYLLLQYLATGDVEEFSSFIDEYPIYRSHLENYGLVNFDDEPPRIPMGIVKETLKIRAGANGVPLRLQRGSKIELDDDETRVALVAEVATRRDRIERRLRQLMNDLLQAKHGRRALDEALSAFPPSRRSEWQHLSIEHLLGRRSPLHWRELQLLVIHHYSLVEGKMRASRDMVDGWFSHINKCRELDAHANDLSEEEIALLRLNLRSFEERLDIIRS